LSWQVPDALRVQFERLRPVLDQIDRENTRLKPLLDQIARERALSAVPQPAPAPSVKRKSGPKKGSVYTGHKTPR
jgi:hypothetical protein